MIGGEKEFTFDSVLTKESQAELYAKLVAPLVDRVLEGYNGCVFTYGQTASGKTYTMGGPDCAEVDKGSFSLAPSDDS